MRFNSLLTPTFTSLALVLGLTSCSLIQEVETLDQLEFLPQYNLELNLMMARGKLGGSNFERYNLKGNRLWSECGDLEKKSSKPIFVPKEQLPSEISNKQLVEIESKYEEITLVLTQRSDLLAGLPKPETPFSIIQDGVFEIKFTSPQEHPTILTSFTALKDGENALLKRIETLTSLIRKSSGRSPCGQRKFFGLGG